jgi:DNA-binding MarR family transcriptional regulator
MEPVCQPSPSHRPTGSPAVSYSDVMPQRAPDHSTLSPLFYVFAASQQAGMLLEVAFEDAPLHPEEYAMYSALREMEPVSPTELARHLGMPVTTALDGVRAMARRGHVSRIDHPDDGRSYFLVLTEPGQRAHDATERHFSGVDERLAAHLGAGRETVIRALADLLDAGDATLAQLRTESAGVRTR